MTSDTQEPAQPHLVIVRYAPNHALMGRRHTLEPSASVITVGRAAGNDIQLDSDSVSRRHARLERRADGWWVVDVGSTQGTFVHVDRVEEAPLRPGDRIRLADVVVQFVRADEPFGPIDPSVLLEHNDILRRLDGELERAHEPGRTVSLVRFVVNHFRTVMSMHGRVAAEQVGPWVASLVRESARPGDPLARYCDEGLELMLPDMDHEAASALAEGVRAKTAARPFSFGERTMAITISTGVAQAGGEVRSAEALVEAADRELLANMRRMPPQQQAPRRMLEYRGRSDERPFLDRAHELGDAERLRYAALIEARDPERAEWLRLEVALHARASDDPALIARFVGLARTIGVDFAGVMLRDMILNCGSEDLKRAPPPIRFAFACTKRWQTLAPTGEPSVRLCQQCEERVYHCETTDEAAKRARAGQCISIPKALSDGGLEYEMMGRPDPVAMWAEHLFPVNGMNRRG